MTDLDPAPERPETPRTASETRSGGLSDWDAVKLVYLLYLVGFFVPLCALAGLIVAYVKRDGAAPGPRSHLRFQIRSFWIGLVATVVGGIGALILIGWLIIALWVVWALIRFITGLLAALDQRPVQDPESWGFTA